MFDLEQVIQGWRREMSDAGVANSEVLDELEEHLRIAVRDFQRAGLDVPEAFHRALEAIGQAGALKREFTKNQPTAMKRTLIILLGVFGILFGPGLILPALAKHQKLGLWNFDILWPIFAGSLIALVGIGLTILGFKKRTA